MSTLDGGSLRAEVEAVLSAAAAAWEVHITCHVFTADLDDAGGQSVIPSPWQYHRSRFCTAVKRRQGAAACVAHDCEVLPGRCAASDACRVETCHAGAVEVIAPVHVAGRLAALLYLGPFASPAARGTLPALGPARRRAVEAAAQALAAWLRDVARRCASGRELGADPRLVRAASFLDTHLAEDPSLGELAVHLGLSAERARHLVSELTGASFRAFKDDLRLAKAKPLLAYGRRSIGEIAAACGSRDPGWFARWFRRRTGLSPSQWRERDQGA